MRYIKWISLVAILCIAETLISWGKQKQVFIYRLIQKDNQEMYDEAMVVSCLQGIVNRNRPQVYLTSSKNSLPDYWLKKFTTEGRWLQGAKIDTLESLDKLFDLVRREIIGSSI